MLSENEKWVLSFYRQSEITGALFFGRLAQYIPNNELRNEITHHFADEAQHARYWTKCINDLGADPIRLNNSYQDKYFDAIGIPANIMEILAITQIFEKRVIDQYNKHLKTNDINPIIAETFKLIMKDEAWHVKWVSEALKKMAPRFGQENIDNTIAKFKKADDEIYGNFLEEHKERVEFLLN